MAATCGGSPRVSSEKVALRNRSDDSTCYTPAAIAGGLGDLVVGIGVHYDRASIGIEERRRSRCQRYTSGAERDLADAARGRDDVWSITGVRTPGVIQAVLLAERVVVGAGSREGSRAALAFADGVEMNSVRARWKSETGDLYVHESVRILPKVSGSDRGSIDVVHDRCCLRDGVAPLLE